MSFKIGNEVYFNELMTITKVNDNTVECTWIADDKKQIGIFDAKNIKLKQSVFGTEI